MSRQWQAWRRTPWLLWQRTGRWRPPCQRGERAAGAGHVTPYALVAGHVRGLCRAHACIVKVNHLCTRGTCPNVLVAGPSARPTGRYPKAPAPTPHTPIAVTHFSRCCLRSALAFSKADISSAGCSACVCVSCVASIDRAAWSDGATGGSGLGDCGKQLGGPFRGCGKPAAKQHASPGPSPAHTAWTPHARWWWWPCEP